MALRHTWIVRRLRNAYWSIMHRIHPRHRYHVLHLKTMPGYSDPRERLVWAMFACLDQYVDEMNGIDGLTAFTSELEAEIADGRKVLYGRGAIQRQVDLQHTAADLYRWWHDEYPALREAADEWTGDLAEEQVERALQDKLTLLLSIREGLWT